MIAAFLCDVCDGTQCPRGKHNFVIVDQRVFVNASIDITSGDVVANLQRYKLCRQELLVSYFVVDRCKVPGDGSVKSVGIDSTGNVNGL